jgi:NADH-quinone oxidoreductase subunit M
MLVALIYMYVKAGNYDIASFHSLPLTLGEQRWIFLAFLLAFAVKVPMWPVHTWLPDAHVEAPTGGSVILAAIMLKMGGYGFLRFSLPIAPDASRELYPLVVALSLIAVIYIGFVAIVQTDMKKLIAYSSISHMGFVTLGAFVVYGILLNTGGLAGAEMGMEGAMTQMISHGLVSGALFLCVGVVYDRMHTREIAAYGGLVQRMPLYAAAFMIFTLANIGLPGTSGFIGEFLSTLGTFPVNSWVALFATTGIILSAAYALYLYRRIIFGALVKPSLQAIQDLSLREIALLTPLVVLTIAMGIFPKPVFDVTSASVANLIAEHQTALAIDRAPNLVKIVHHVKVAQEGTRP